ncbi:MAG: enoyl-CoA hydratase/isomerase family protein [Candidatus Aminicenantes bacterium]|nr:enoyl-CoA hydratase/isomerase family protein [Candidatus Aminicenantes bacterium]
MINVDRNERVLHLKINVPPVNVFDTAACNELAGKLKEAAADETIAAVLLSGEGKCFSAGASVEEHGEELAKKMIPAFTAACQALYEMPVPTVALIHGFCFGGGFELVLYADFIVADPTASFAVPEIKLAFFPPLACSALPGIVGRQNAAHLIFTGDTIDAERAHAVGLVQKIAGQSEWENIAKGFNRKSAPVLRLAKEAFRLGLKTPVEETDGTITKDLFLKRLYEIEDLKEGIASFGEKRKPAWKHR